MFGNLVSIALSDDDGRRMSKHSSGNSAISGERLLPYRYLPGTLLPLPVPKPASVGMNRLYRGFLPLLFSNKNRMIQSLPAWLQRWGSKIVTASPTKKKTYIKS